MTLKDVQNLIRRADGELFRIVVIRGQWFVSLHHGPGVFIAQGNDLDEAVQELAKVVLEHVPDAAAPN